MVDGHDITALSKRALAKFRRDELGFIFQDFNLLDTLNGMENIALALTIKHVPPAEVARRVQEIAQTLGVAEVLGKYPARCRAARSSAWRQRALSWATRS